MKKTDTVKLKIENMNNDELLDDVFDMLLHYMRRQLDDCPRTKLMKEEIRKRMSGFKFKTRRLFVKSK